MDKKVIEEIIKEREKQLSKGFDSVHDDTHKDGELLHTAIEVCRCIYDSSNLIIDDWGITAYRTDRECLIIAAALIVAEIERLDRITSDSN